MPTAQAWTLQSFNAFLLSSDNSPYLPSESVISHDMTRPLPEYFISSSHNTYLVGHQLVGDSTVEGYIRALLHGCRSVERTFFSSDPSFFAYLPVANPFIPFALHPVDIWDGENEPAIYHGRTLTTKVSLSDVAKAIARYAFVASPYPLIISAEIHCSLKQQDMAAEIMQRYDLAFGDDKVTGRFTNYGMLSENLAIC